jgi:hypothetical protein
MAASERQWFGADVFVVQNLAQVLEAVRFAPVALLEHRRGAVGDIEAGIAKRHHLCVGLAHDALNMIASAPVVAEHGHADLVVGRERARRRQMRSAGAPGAEYECPTTAHEYRTPRGLGAVRRLEVAELTSMGPPRPAVTRVRARYPEKRSFREPRH